MTNCLAILVILGVMLFSATTWLTSNDIVGSFEATSTPQIPSPGFEEDILFTYLSPECELPCWNDLAIESATEDDFLGSLSSLGASSKPYQLSMSDFAKYDSQWRVVEAKRIQSGDTIFQFAVTATGFFQYEILKGFYFEWEDYSLLDMSPSRVLQELGQPSNIFVFYDVLRGKVLWLQYADLGTDFVYLTFNTTRTAPYRICTEIDHWIDYGKLFVFITDDESRDIRETILGKIITDTETLFSLEDTGEFTPEAFTEAVLKNDVCFEVDESMVIKADE